jgi:hypothetical protein
MALFGTDMVNVQTPDGRRLTLPAQLAQQFPGLQPVAPLQQSLGPSLGGAAPGPPPAPVPEVAAPAPPPGPVTAPSQSAPTGPTPAPPRGPVTSPAQVPEPGPVNTPKPPTDAELAKRGVAGGLAAENAGYDQQAAAVRTGAMVDADAATQIGQAMAARDAQAQAELEKRAKVAEQQQAQLDRAMQERQMAAKALADKKIDRSADHPVLSMISIVLGAIGTAMVDRDAAITAAIGGRAAPQSTGENPALRAFYASIDRKVAAQMADIEKGRGDLAETDKTIAMMRANGADRLQTMDVLRDAALQQAQRGIETLKTKLGAPRAQANADMLLADIQQKRAASENQAASTAYQRIQAEQARKDQLQMHAQSVGVQLRGQNLEQGRWQQDFAEKKRQFDIKEANDLEAVRLAHPGKTAAAAAAALKDNEERGIGDPATGSYLLQPEGAKVAKEAEGHQATAEQFRAAADREQDPGRRSALAARADAEAQKAAELRIEASTTGTWRVGKDERKEVSSLASTAQTIASTADEIKLLRQKYGNEFTSSAAKAEMQEKSTALLMYLKNAWKLGVLSGSDAEYIESATGGDPSKLTAADVSSLFGSPDKAARLDSLVSGVEQMTRNELRGKGFRGEFKIRRDEAANLTPEGQAAADALAQPTPGEEIQGAGRTGKGALDTVGTAADSYLNPQNTWAALSGNPSDPKRRREINAEQRATGRGDVFDIPGLNDTQAKAVEANILAYKQNVGATDEASRTRAKKAADTLIGLASSDRQSLSGPVLDALGEHAPELQKQAFARLPKPLATARSGREQTVLENTSVGILKQNALGGDEASKAELGRRAISGDKDAVRAVADLINARKVR